MSEFTTWKVYIFYENNVKLMNLRDKCFMPDIKCVNFTSPSAYSCAGICSSVLLIPNSSVLLGSLS